MAEDKKKRAARQNREAAEGFRNLAAIARVSDPANARTYYAEAVSLDPEHVEGLYWHGFMQKQAGFLDKAETAFRSLFRFGEENKDDRWLYRAHLGVGDLLVARGDLNGARIEFETARDLAARLATAHPVDAEWQSDLSKVYHKIGDVLRAQGNLGPALDSYQASRAIRERLTQADPTNATWQQNLAVSHGRIGDVLRAQGNLSDALDSYRASLAIRERLAAADPGNAGWQRGLIVSNVKLAEIAGQAGESAAARAHHEAALAIATGLNQSGRLTPPDAWMVEDLESRLAALPD